MPDRDRSIQRLRFIRDMCVRAVGWAYLALGAAILAGFFDGWRQPPDPGRVDGGAEWMPLSAPILLLGVSVLVVAGYRVLRNPPLHRRRIILLGFAVLVGAFAVWRG